MSADASAFADLPAPPCYAVIFSSQRSGDDEAGYARASARMVELVREQPGFLGAESARGADGFGITVAYFDSEDAIRGWREHAEHAAARELGHRRWYERFQVRVAVVHRAYGGPRASVA
ncbi:antibiotic biosynthesis monooxygenase [Lysobacter sp. K5869]|uniref:antibiotic biosynthesis monooxygenase family protein n=1 Tax=Lysobacter sp. K5869 TaxID=2820808 RepID=UPI001C063D44|nr:antibiotic biosynthesis monooxygenase [Lysobacter sp. K5869]QWP78199.1 antibiotic biosynthesis monooxygenase [Lysobacter sp. K5869]